MFGALCVWGAMTTPLHAQDQASEHFLYHRGETEVEMVTPPTPEAASRTRYVDIPVSYGMGTATMEVPIYELKGRHLSVPVRLSYRCGGIKADDIAGAEGLGWTLEAGGCITREVVFMPDEFRNWSFYEQPDDALLADLEALANTNDTQSFVRRTVWRQIDTGSDHYSYNVCGLSGSFIIKPNKEVIPLSGDGVQILFHPSNMTFTLIGPDGTRYLMATKEIGTRLNLTVNYSLETGQQEEWTAPTAWYLTEITSADGTETATFTYTQAGTWEHNTETTAYTWNRTISASIEQSLVDFELHLFSPSRVERSYEAIVLSQIDLGNDHVYFNYASESSRNNLLDRLGYGAWNFPKCLTGISVRGGGDAIHRDWVVNTGYSQDGRILLTQLSEYRHNTLYDRWSFSYNDRGGSSKYSQDWYGYSNGETGRNDLCPYSVIHNPISTSIQLSYGTPNPSYSDNLSLSEVNHDGARTVFEYEPNLVPYTPYAGQSDTTRIGIRIRKIKVYDGDNLVRTREYSYDGAKSTSGTTPILLDYLRVTASRYTTVVTLPSPHYRFHYSLCESSQYQGPSLNSTQVLYARVTEDVYGSAGPEEGSSRTIYHFKTTGINTFGRNLLLQRFPNMWEDLYELGCGFGYANNYVDHSYTDSAHGDYGLLERKEQYRWANGTYSMVLSEDTEYSSPGGTGYLSSYSVHQVMTRTEPDNVGEFHLSDQYHYPVKTYRVVHSVPIKRTLVHYRQGGNDTTITHLGYTAGDITYPQRICRLTLKDNGEYRTIAYEYPDNSSMTGAAYDSLIARHILTPVLSTSWNHVYGNDDFFQDTLGLVLGLRRSSNTEMCHSIQFETQYDIFQVNGHPFPLPCLKNEITDGQVSYTEQILSRDILGNIRSVKAKSRPETILIWGYKGQYPVAVVENATSAEVIGAMNGLNAINTITTNPTLSSTQSNALNELRGALPNAHVTTFTHIPSVGLSSQTTPDGLTTTYVWDNNERLSEVRDAAGNCVEAYTYNLLNSIDPQDPNKNRLSLQHRTYRSSNENAFVDNISWWNTLGMKLEEIAVGASSDGADLVSAFGGDFLGHDDVRSWLPYPAATISGLNSGSFRPDAPSETAAYYNDAHPYALKQYELSGRDKVEITALPGHDPAHKDRSWDVGLTGFPRLQWEGDSIRSVDTWIPSALLTSVLEDADDNQTITITDRLETPIATLRCPSLFGIGPQPHGVPITAPQDPTASVFYVYDRNDRLRAVFGGGIALTDTLNMWRYSYDSLGRVYSKAIPGGIREFYAYDNEDRIIVIQRDTLLFETEYDNFSRPLKRYRRSVNTLPEDRELLEEHRYDSRDQSSVLLLAFRGHMWLESDPIISRETYTKTAIMDSNDVITGYAESATRYDEKGRPQFTVTRYPGNTPSHYGVHTLEMLYNFSNSPIQTTESFYDDVSPDDWALFGINMSALATLRTVTDYNLRERPTETRTQLWLHGVSSSADTTRFNYDALGRLSVKQSHCGGYSFITTDTYTLQGGLASRNAKLGSHPLFGETLIYDGYNSLNGFSPSYTGRITGKQEQWSDAWSIFGDVNQYATESYRYDAAGRLSEVGRFNSESLPSSPVPSSLQNRESFTYDKRSNLTERRCRTVGSRTNYIDQYILSGDRLSELIQLKETLPQFHSQPIITDTLASKAFSYDALGRMTENNLSREQILYNHLSLPATVSRGDTLLVNYSYLANGTKLSALGADNAGLIYVGSLVLRRDDLGALSFDSAHTPAGRITSQGVRYHVTDHLGSVRAVVGGAAARPVVVPLFEASDYDAYGQRTDADPSAFATIPSLAQGDPIPRHHFTGKEDQGAVDGIGVSTIDFGARHYSPSLRRWLVPDPLSEDYYGISPYAYCAGDPINLMDEDGKSTRVIYIGNGKYRVIGGNLEDNDLNVYLYNRNADGEYEPTRISIGITTSITSFYNADINQWSTNSIIDMNDKSGKEFLDFVVDSNFPLPLYAALALPHQLLDFKYSNGTFATKDDGMNQYRGMPIGVTSNELPVISSARDIGNMAAGYEAGVHGLLWSSTRLFFDSLESLQNLSFSSESVSSQNAQFLGWANGFYKYQNTHPLLERMIRRLFPF